MSKSQNHAEGKQVGPDEHILYSTYVKLINRIINLWFLK